MLVLMLRSHPDIWANGEVFGGDQVNGLLGRYATKTRNNTNFLQEITRERNQNPEKFLYKYVLDTQDRQVAGFKLKSDELVMWRYRKIKKIVTTDTDLKIIHLNRKNLLERFLSYHVVNHQTGVTMLTNEKDRPEIEPVFLDPISCERDFKEALKRRRYLENLFRNHRSIHVNYEDLATGRAEYTDPICEFLEVDKLPLKLSTLKIVDKQIDETIVNYRDILEYFRGTQYEEFVVDGAAR